MKPPTNYLPNTAFSLKNECGMFSRASEAGVLGSMIVDPEIIDKIRFILGPDSFYLAEHKIIYHAILDLWQSEATVDGLLVHQHLERQGKLEKIGGAQYLQNVINTVPNSNNAEHYARTVKQCWIKRQCDIAARKYFNFLNDHTTGDDCVAEFKKIADSLLYSNERYGQACTVIKNLSEVESQPIDWFWQNRIPCGMLTLILGDPGLGKSFLSLYMAAKVSVGGNWPDNSSPENKAPDGSVIILTAEDDLGRVVRPRLDTLGADVSKILSIEAVRIRDENNRMHEDSFKLGRDIPALKHILETRKDVKLIIIDPLSAYLGSGIDSHKDADVRGVLMPLVDLAEQYNAAVVGIVHMNKNMNNKAVYRALGSIAFTASARTVWLVSNDPKNPKSKRRLLVPAKQNVLINPTGLAFEIIDGRVVFENEPVDISADEALEQKSSVEAPEKNRAVQWLKQILTGKEISSTELELLAENEGISHATFRNAKKKLGVISRPVKGNNGNNIWIVKLPNAELKNDEQHRTTLNNIGQVLQSNTLVN